MHDKANACMTDQTGPHLVVEVAILQSCLIFAKEILAVGSDEAESDLLMQTIHACQEKNHRLVFSKASAKKTWPCMGLLKFLFLPKCSAILRYQIWVFSQKCELARHGEHINKTYLQKLQPNAAVRLVRTVTQELENETDFRHTDWE